VELTSFMVADGVRQGADSKLYIFGGQWDRINAPAVPTTQSVALALVLEVTSEEVRIGSHEISVSFRREDGDLVGPQIKAKLELDRPPDLKPGAPMYLPLAIEAQPIEFDRYGRYEWIVESGDTILGRRVIDVIPSRPDL
jgi:hypothetical protein